MPGEIGICGEFSNNVVHFKTVMVLSLSISSETETKLNAKAAAAGVDIATYATKSLERIATRPTLDEVLAPLRAEFDRRGMTEQELAELLEKAKHEARAEERSRKIS